MRGTNVDANAGATTLDNCASEPIHIPGLVQSHGTLCAFDQDGVLCHVSANASALLGPGTPELGSKHSGSLLDAHTAVRDAIQESLDSQDLDEQGFARELRLEGRFFDLVTHRYAGLTIIELEPRSASDKVAGSFAVRARRAMSGLKNQTSIEQLLQMAVVAVRQLTGFDRAMADRFRHDDSGERAVHQTSLATNRRVSTRKDARRDARGDQHVQVGKLGRSKEKGLRCQHQGRQSGGSLAEPLPHDAVKNRHCDSAGDN